MAGRITALAFVFCAYLTSTLPLVCTQSTQTHNRIIIFPDDNTNGTLFKQFMKSNDEIQININNNFSFFVIQIHSFATPIVLSNGTDKVEGESVGLVEMSGGNSYEYTIGGTFDNVLVAVTTYGEKDPIPGGCNLTFDVEVAPYQKVFYTNDLIEVQAQAASAYNKICEANAVKLEMYQMYLQPWDLSGAEFFNGIENMLTPELIRKHGSKVPDLVGYTPLRRYYVNYKGFGRIFGIIATFENQSSAYIPIASYGCNVQHCFAPFSVDWLIMATLFLIGGVVTAFVNQILEALPTFFAVVILIIYSLYQPTSLILQNQTYLSVPLALLAAIFFILLGRRCKFNYNILNAVCSGYFLTVLLFMFPFIGDQEMFQNYLTYWVVIAGAVVVSALLFLTPSKRKITFISFMFTAIGIDMFFSGIIFYAILNNVNHIMVPNFAIAVISPPFYIADLLALLFGQLIVIIGYKVQTKLLRTRSGAENEPLLVSSTHGYGGFLQP